MKKKLITTPEETEHGGLTIKDFLAACGARWIWFLVSIIGICALAAFYVMRQQPKYLRTEQVLIKDQDSGGSTDAIASAFASMGLGSSNSNVYNELITLQSPALMSQVVEKLELQDNYILKGFPHGTTLYRTTLPFKVSFPDLPENYSCGMRIEVNPDGSARLYKFYQYGKHGKEKFPGSIDLAPGFKTVKTPLGRVIFTPNPEFTGDDFDDTEIIMVSHQSKASAVENYTKQLKADLTDRDADVIDLSIKDVNIARAEDVLSTIIEVYNQDWMDDKNKMAVATNAFIDERLRLIQQELGDVDSELFQYKERTLVPDLEQAAKINMATSASLDEEALKTNNELSMAKYVRDYVVNPNNLKNVIPVNTGMGNVPLENQISEYNSLLLLRNNLAEGSSESNPIVKDYDAQLKGRREAIVQGINTQIGTLEKVMKNLQGAKGTLKNDLASVPKQAKYLLSIERQQTVKESLYLYLLQKKEENELSQTFTANNTRIITPPYGPLKPVAPKKMLIMAIAFLLSVILPGGIIYMQEAGNTKVRSRKDLERMSTPFAGEIPYVGKKIKFAWLKNLFRNKRKSRRQLETLPVMVQPGSRDIINESFRIVRGNIDYMLQHDESSNILMITSFNAGSGKSFITYNLAASFAIKGKSVLVIDCDLRHGSASQFVGMPSHGLSQYLSGATDDYRQLIVKDKNQANLSVMPIGHRPPNPAELLDNGRIGTMLQEVSKEYDYVFLDCPPLDVVVDTQILEKYIGTTLFVIRAGLLDQTAVDEIDGFYKNHRFRRMCILLNGTEGRYSHSRQYGSSYYTSDAE